MLRRAFFLLSIVMPMPALASANGAIYGFVDEDGVERFSNVPDDRRYKLVLADRLAGSRTLNLMYDEFSEGTMAQIKERALSSLFEMARWRHLQHALPAYLLLGRVSGVAEQEMAAAWEASERDQMLARIEKLLKPVTAKKK